MNNKPHLVLNWTFDIPNHKLFIKLADDLEYEALEGGCSGFTKTYQGVVSHVTLLEWQETEKFWISNHYGDTYGYFQPDQNRTKKHPTFGWDQVCVNGVGPDGEYIDHMQRMQVLLEGNDMSIIWGLHPPIGTSQKELFVTPDRGLTIYKRMPTRDVNYPAELMKDVTAFWPEWSQACLMQPRTSGVQLSSYEELKNAGASQSLVDRCARGEWESAPNPELQQWYIYPTK